MPADPQYARIGAAAGLITPTNNPGPECSVRIKG